MSTIQCVLNSLYNKVHLILTTLQDRFYHPYFIDGLRGVEKLAKDHTAKLEEL